jgi:hypothetical protein
VLTLTPRQFAELWMADQDWSDVRRVLRHALEDYCNSELDTLLSYPSHERRERFARLVANAERHESPPAVLPEDELRVLLYVLVQVDSPTLSRPPALTRERCAALDAAATRTWDCWRGRDEELSRVPNDAEPHLMRAEPVRFLELSCAEDVWRDLQVIAEDSTRGANRAQLEASLWGDAKEKRRRIDGLARLATLADAPPLLLAQETAETLWWASIHIDYPFREAHPLSRPPRLSAERYEALHEALNACHMEIVYGASDEVASKLL